MDNRNGKRENDTQRKDSEDSLYLEGRNAIREALSAGVQIQRVWLLRDDEKGTLAALKKSLREHGISWKETDRAFLDRMSRTGHHQGIIAMAAPVALSQMEDAFSLARERGEDPFLFLLDGIEDPHNVGAIIRTAEALGAHGVVVTKDRCAPLTETVMRASAGALNHIPVIRVTNLVRTIEDLKKQSLWFICADMDGTAMWEVGMTGPVGLVIGSEGSGVSRLVRQHCDLIASVPLHGKVSSLNASVAAGILGAEIVRQRTVQGKQR